LSDWAESGSGDKKSSGVAFFCRHSCAVCYQNSQAEKKQIWDSFWLGEQKTTYDGTRKEWLMCFIKYRLGAGNVMIERCISDERWVGHVLSAS
jgi:hypothetical protein